MRAIKFRVRNETGRIFAREFIDDGKWNYVLYSENGTEWQHKYGVCFLPGRREQFTGLLDKNGREIYEGDVVRCGGHVYICRWNPHRLEFAWYSQDGLYIYPIGDMRTDLEIIGNIYENPELLEVPHA
jgi:hypothetical protein